MGSSFARLKKHYFQYLNLSLLFKVSVQASPCVDWELQPPVNGVLNCVPNDVSIECIASCKPGYRFTDNEQIKSFVCAKQRIWRPTSVVPDCVSENTEQADYHVTATISYRANGAVPPSCLPQYQEYLQQSYDKVNRELSNTCSAVNAMNVSIIRSLSTLLDENVVRLDFIMAVMPTLRQTDLYNLCGSTLKYIFDLNIPQSNAAVEPLLNVANIGNQCPPLRALKSSTARGFECNVGEVLNMDTNNVPRCLHCPAGTFAGERQNTCTYCPRGFYQNRDRQGSCLACPSGTYTREEGSKSLNDCIPVCGFGTFSPTVSFPLIFRNFLSMIFSSDSRLTILNDFVHVKNKRV